MSNAFFLLQGADRASIILGGVWCFALQQNARSSGLEGRQSTGEQTLALGPAAGFHGSLPSPPDLGHFHVGQQQAAFFCWYLIFCLFLQVCCRWAGEDVGGGGGANRYPRYQQSLCGLKVMFANHISGDWRHTCPQARWWCGCFTLLLCHDSKIF